MDPFDFHGIYIKKKATMEVNGFHQHLIVTILFNVQFKSMFHFGIKKSFRTSKSSLLTRTFHKFALTCFYNMEGFKMEKNQELHQHYIRITFYCIQC